MSLISWGKIEMNHAHTSVMEHAMKYLVYGSVFSAALCKSSDWRGGSFGMGLCFSRSGTEDLFLVLASLVLVSLGGLGVALLLKHPLLIMCSCCRASCIRWVDI